MKRYIALLLALTMVATLMSGCIIKISNPDETKNDRNDATEDPVDDVTEGPEDVDTKQTETDPRDDGNPPDPLELILIVGNHQNAWLSLEDLADSDGEFMELLARTMEYGTDGKNYTAKCHLKVIVCDGTPSEVKLKKPNGKNLEMYMSDVNEGYIKNDYLEELTDDIVDALQGDGVRANDTEVDLVAALREASMKFETTDREHMIYIMDTGLCTTGHMKLKANRDGEVDILEPSAKDLLMGMNTGAFPDLEGVRVKFRNFADFCGEQEIFDDNNLIDNFEILWKTYLEACGVENPEVEYNGSEYDEAVDLYDASLFPSVSVVKFKKTNDAIILRPANAPFDKVEDANLILNGASVGGFDINAHVPNDVEAAKQIAAEMKVFIDRILDREYYPDCIFYVIGSSSYVKDKFKDFDPDAEARANTVAEYLVEAGVPRDKIKVIDAGSNELPWRNADEFKEKNANQVVAIIPSYRVEIMRDLHERLPDRIPAPEETN